MLFQWFNATAYLPNDKTGNALEKLKSEYLPNWLQKVNWNDRILFWIVLCARHHQLNSWNKDKRKISMGQHIFYSKDIRRSNCAGKILH